MNMQVMHISVYTEAFDNCIHRIKYLNKYKNNKNTQLQQKPKEVYKATRQAVCPPYLKNEIKKVAG